MNAYTFPFLSTQSVDTVLPAFDRIAGSVEDITSIYFKITSANKFKVSAASTTEKFTVYIYLTDAEINEWVKSIDNVKVDGITKSSVSYNDDNIACVMNFKDFVIKLKSINRNRKIASLTALEAVESTEITTDEPVVIQADKVTIEACNEVIKFNSPKPLANHSKTMLNKVKKEAAFILNALDFSQTIWLGIIDEEDADEYYFYISDSIIQPIEISVELYNILNSLSHIDYRESNEYEEYAYDGDDVKHSLYNIRKLIAAQRSNKLNKLLTAA